MPQNADLWCQFPLLLLSFRPNEEDGSEKPVTDGDGGQAVVVVAAAAVEVVAETDVAAAIDAAVVAGKTEIGESCGLEKWSSVLEPSSNSLHQNGDPSLILSENCK